MNLRKDHYRCCSPRRACYPCTVPPFDGSARRRSSRRGGRGWTGPLLSRRRERRRGGREESIKDGILRSACLRRLGRRSFPRPFPWTRADALVLGTLFSLSLCPLFRPVGERGVCLCSAVQLSNMHNFQRWTPRLVHR